MLKNLIFRNPGFEGETWQTNFRCTSVSQRSCTDDKSHFAWPDHFLDSASFEVISGIAKGTQGFVSKSFRATPGAGFTLVFSDSAPHLANGDFVQLRLEKPGNAQAGWWTSASGSAIFSTEFHDLSPESPGKQSLRINAVKPGQEASVSSYLDSLQGHSFVRLTGRYSLRFRAKSLGGESTLAARFARGNHIFLNKNVTLAPRWQDYNLEFACNEDKSSFGTAGLTFEVRHSDVLIDDVELTPLWSSATNPTAFRDEVVETLLDLRPGIIRFMDNGTSFGSTVDDLLAPPFARRRGGILFNSTSAEDIPIGLPECLRLAQSIHADPWFTLPATITPREATDLLQYLGGPPSTKYGAKRVAFGQAPSWISTFHTIHLELGNEMWGTYPGSNIADPQAYQLRASEIFAAIQASPYYSDAHFDLIGNAQSENLWWTKQSLLSANHQTSLDLGPYLFGRLDDFSSIEAVFGAMLAEPEALDTNGVVAQQVRLLQTADHPLKPEVYEVNLGTSSSNNPSITQLQIDSTVASIGAGIAVVDHMLLMLRELGITTQCFFALPEFQNVFHAQNTATRMTPLFGAVVDMGGATNRRRPVFYALQLANRALLKDELTVRLTGANPTWDQAASSNAESQASRPHLLQVFAFRDGTRRSLILLNLSRSSPLTVTFDGPERPSGHISESRLTALHITDTNESQQEVSPATRTLDNLDPSAPYRLPPYSMTVLEWQDYS